MDIRLIRNFEEYAYEAIDDNVILQIEDDDYQMDRFVGKKFFLVDLANNERQEIMPSVRKYNLLEITDILDDHNYIYFSEAARQNTNEVSITLCRYRISTAELERLYTFETTIFRLHHEKYRVFVLDELNLCVQCEAVTVDEELCVTSTQLVYNLLYNISEQTQISICDANISTLGIDQMIPIGGNICIIKLGYSRLSQMLYSNPVGQSPNEVTELVGFVNVKQFISDITLKKESISIDVQDTAEEHTTFPYVKYREGWLVYSKAYPRYHREEVTMLDYDTKVSKVRISDHLVRVSDLMNTYIINDAPYYLERFERGSRLINMDTQKPELKLSGDSHVCFIKNDLLIIEEHVQKNFLRKEAYYTIAYRYPNMQNRILYERSRFTKCLVTPQDNLLIFCK